MIAMDLSKQQELDADPGENQQIGFSGNLEHDGATIMFFMLEQTK